MKNRENADQEWTNWFDFKTGLVLITILLIVVLVKTVVVPAQEAKENARRAAVEGTATWLTVETSVGGGAGSTRYIITATNDAGDIETFDTLTSVCDFVVDAEKAGTIYRYIATGDDLGFIDWTHYIIYVSEPITGFPLQNTAYAPSEDASTNSELPVGSVEPNPNLPIQNEW